MDAVAELVSRAAREDLMLMYNLPIFTEGDANAFLAGIARANGYMKKVRSHPPSLRRHTPSPLYLI